MGKRRVVKQCRGGEREREDDEGIISQISKETIQTFREQYNR